MSLRASRHRRFEHTNSRRLHRMWEDSKWYLNHIIILEMRDFQLKSFFTLVLVKAREKRFSIIVMCGFVSEKGWLGSDLVDPYHFFYFMTCLELSLKVSPQVGGWLMSNFYFVSEVSKLDMSSSSSSLFFHMIGFVIKRQKPIIL